LRPGPREQAVLRAFAEALLPTGERLPGAEGSAGVAVVGPVFDLLAKAPPRLRLVARFALAVLELSAFPRRFSTLTAERRAVHLQRFETGRGVRRDLFLLLKSLVAFAYARDGMVQQKVGAQGRCELALAVGEREPSQRPPRLERAAMEMPEGSERCDVAVVGSGAGGAAIARVLAESGLSVIVVEEGHYHDAASYSSDPFQALAALYRDGGLTVCEGRPAIPLPIGRCVGGTTVINSGTCFRTPGDVLVRWREQFGIGWATDLDREFESLERDLLVRPVDPATAGRNAALCRAGAEAIGASNGPISRNAGSVVCCGTCPSGCALDAKQATHVSELPRAVAAGCRVRAGARVVRVIVERGRAAGISARAANGRRYEVRARSVVLAAGAIGTPSLLLAQGIGNTSGQLGRNLKVHPACWVGARFEEDVRGWEGVMQSWHVDEWNDRGLFLEATFAPFAFGAHWLPGSGAAFVERIEHYDRLAVIGVHLSEHSSRGRVRLAGKRARIGYRLSEQDAIAIRYGIARAADIHFAAGASIVYPQIAGVPALSASEGGDSIDRTRLKPSDLRLEAFHPMGTTRMGADPHSSVVSPTGETHDLPGLYIADAGVFPTSLRVNPMITIMACARRIGGGLANRFA
jgi:choline dehydrogenase-like flavoprotein